MYWHGGCLVVGGDILAPQGNERLGDSTAGRWSKSGHKDSKPDVRSKRSNLGLTLSLIVCLAAGALAAPPKVLPRRALRPAGALRNKSVALPLRPSPHVPLAGSERRQTTDGIFTERTKRPILRSRDRALEGVKDGALGALSVLAKMRRTLGEYWPHKPSAANIRQAIHRRFVKDPDGRAQALVNLDHVAFSNLFGIRYPALRYLPMAAARSLAWMQDIKKDKKVRFKADLITFHKPTSGNRLELLVDGDAAFPRIFEEVRAATDHVHLCYYIFEPDKLGLEFAELLMKKAREGVKVRLSIDWIKNVIQLPKMLLMVRKLRKAGAEVYINIPFRIRSHKGRPGINRPDHRKLVIVDGKVGFTGGMNVGNQYVEEYHDLFLRTEGPIVHQLQANWMSHWLRNKGKALEDQDLHLLAERYYPRATLHESGAPQSVRVAQNVPTVINQILAEALSAIERAKESVHVENPYLTNPSIQRALLRAGRRGVEVNVVLPSTSDHGFSHWAARAKYPELIKAGVNIYEYPGFCHGKVMVIDRAMVSIGTSNLDDVALYHIHETNLQIHDRAFAADVLKRVFDLDIASSRKLRIADITKRQIWIGKFWSMFTHFI